MQRPQGYLRVLPRVYLFRALVPPHWHCHNCGSAMPEPRDGYCEECHPIEDGIHA